MRQVWKIRLKPDGTWENVYKDEFYELDGKGLAEWHASKFYDASEYLEKAVELSGMRDAKEIIDCLMKK